MADTVSDFLLQRLSAWDIRRIYGFPGDGINGLMGSLDRAGDRFSFLRARHEEMTAFMACARHAVHLHRSIADEALQRSAWPFSAQPGGSGRPGAPLFVGCLAQTPVLAFVKRLDWRPMPPTRTHGYSVNRPS